MPEWLEKQFDCAERTVQNWSPGKREAAGIPITELELLERQLAQLREEEKKIMERIELLNSTVAEISEWLERQIDNVERTVNGWSESKREAAGIPPK